MKGCRGRLGIGRPNGVKAVRKRGSRREVCEHGKQWTRCIECAQGYTSLGSRDAICQHGQRRTRCIQCGAGSICEHGKQRSPNGVVCRHPSPPFHCTKHVRKPLSKVVSLGGRSSQRSSQSRASFSASALAAQSFRASWMQSVWGRPPGQKRFGMSPRASPPEAIPGDIHPTSSPGLVT